MKYKILSLAAGFLFGSAALSLKVLLNDQAPLMQLLLIAGGLTLSGFVVMQMSLKHKKASHVMLLSSVAATVLPIVGGISLLHEAVSTTEMAGIALAVAAACVLMLKEF